MAYHVAEGVAENTADFMAKLKAFVIGTCGWNQIQDATFGAGGAISANTYLAASSAGESGNDTNIIRFIRQNANAITAEMHLSYVTGGPPGTARTVAGSTSATLGTGTYVDTDDGGEFYYWIMGSLDRIVIATAVGARIGNLDMLYVGSYTRSRSNQFAACTNAPAAGAGILFNTANTALFAVGKRYVIADNNNFESPKVTAINPGVSVTLDVLNNAYAIGARLGEDPRPGIVTVSGSTMGWTSANWLVAPPMRQSLGSPAGAALSGAQHIIDTVAIGMLERSVDFLGLAGGPDGGGGGTANALVNMFPLQIYDPSLFSGDILGQLTEVYAVSRAALATDQTINIGGSTYQVLNSGAGNLATGGGVSGALAVAVRTV